MGQLRCRIRSCALPLLLAFLLVSMPGSTAHAAPPPDRVLAFTRAAQFRHDSIAIPTLRSVVATEDMQVDATGAATDFTPANLADTG